MSKVDRRGRLESDPFATASQERAGLHQPRWTTGSTVSGAQAVRLIKELDRGDERAQQSHWPGDGDLQTGQRAPVDHLRPVVPAVRLGCGQA